MKPELIMVETYDRCNLSCTVCCAGKALYPKKNENTFLSLSIIESIINAAKKINPIPIVQLGYRSEFFCDPRAAEIIDICKDVPLLVVTNGTLLMKNINILKNINEILISVLGARQGEFLYDEITSLDYWKTIRIIKELSRDFGNIGIVHSVYTAKDALYLLNDLKNVKLRRITFNQLIPPTDFSNNVYSSNFKNEAILLWDIFSSLIHPLTKKSLIYLKQSFAKGINTCPHRLNEFCVNANGEVELCCVGIGIPLRKWDDGKEFFAPDLIQGMWIPHEHCKIVPCCTTWYEGSEK